MASYTHNYTLIEFLSYVRMALCIVWELRVNVRCMMYTARVYWLQRLCMHVYMHIHACYLEHQ